MTQPQIIHEEYHNFRGFGMAHARAIYILATAYRISELSVEDYVRRLQR